jgi:hypothetical protein
MAVSFVLALHKMEAHSSMQCQIVVLRVQSKRRHGKAGLQPLHASCRNFVMFFSVFLANAQEVSVS